VAAWKSPRYLVPVAACYAQLGGLEQARAQVAELLRLQLDLRLPNVVMRFKNPADTEHMLDGLRKAGLPA